MPASVKVKGLKELDKAFKDVDKKLHQELRAELKELAEPVAARSRVLGARFGAKTASGYQAGSRSGMAVVRQRQKKTTGFHSGFGALQMRTVLVPALASEEHSIIAGVDRLIDRIAIQEGF